MIVEMPIRTISEANCRDHWAKKARRVKEQRTLARVLVMNEVGRKRMLGRPVSVALKRIGPRRLDDDNLRGALKAVRDGVADALCIDDGSAAVTWGYSQDSRRRTYRVEVVIECEGEK